MAILSRYRGADLNNSRRETFLLSGVASHILLGPVELPVLSLLAGPRCWAPLDVDECRVEEVQVGRRTSCSALVLRGIRLVARSCGLRGGIPLSRLLFARGLRRGR